MEIQLLSGALGAEINGISLKDSSKENCKRIRYFRSYYLAKLDYR